MTSCRSRAPAITRVRQSTTSTTTSRTTSPPTNREWLQVLTPGQRIIGDWLGQAHGTRYDIEEPHEAFVVFDLMEGQTRQPWSVVVEAAIHLPVSLPGYLRTHEPMEPVAAFETLIAHHIIPMTPPEQPEGVVFRLERRGKVEFLAKWVRPDFVPGVHLSEISGEPDVWNFRFMDWLQASYDPQWAHLTGDAEMLTNVYADRASWDQRAPAQP